MYDWKFVTTILTLIGELCPDVRLVYTSLTLCIPSYGEPEHLLNRKQKHFSILGKNYHNTANTSVASKFYAAKRESSYY